MHVCHLNLAAGFSGGERQTLLLMEQLAEAGWRQTLVARPGSLAARASPFGRVLRVSGGRWLTAPATAGADLYHAHEARAVYMAWALGLRASAPFLLTRRVDNSPRYGRFKRLVYRRAAARTAVSEAVAAVMRELDPLPVWQVIPDAAAGFTPDPARVASIRAQFPDRFLIGHVGALDQSAKGQLHLIEAMRTLRARGCRCSLLLIGEGRDEARFREAASDLKEVRFVGHVDDVGSYLAALDLFAFPSLHEGLGSSVLDAMQAGLAVVASGVGGLPEVVLHEQTGLLVPPGDSRALADAIARLANDAALRRRLGAAGRHRAADFSAARMAQRYRSIYEQVLSGRREAQDRGG